MSICVFSVQISNFNIIYLKRISVPFVIPDNLSTFATIFFEILDYYTI